MSEKISRPPLELDARQQQNQLEELARLHVAAERFQAEAVRALVPVVRSMAEGYGKLASAYAEALREARDRAG